jgi:UDP-glucose-4-epimerase GalE
VSSKNILVTGGAGYIGSHTAKALSSAGYTPVVIDNLSMGHKWAVRWGPLVQGDLADRLALEQTLRDYRIEGVVHFAASAYVGESMKLPHVYFRNNSINTLNLLEAMLSVGVKRIVFSSTCATYGNPTRIPIPEDHPQIPVNPYGESKLFIEKVLHWYEQACGFNWVALRYFNAAGADLQGEIGEDHSPETHLIPLAIEVAMGRRKAFEIFGSDYPTPDGTAVRDYVHVGDLAVAHLLAWQYLMKGGKSRAFNLGTGSGYSVLEVIDAIEERAGGCIPATKSPRRAGDPPQLIADATAATQLLGWRPAHSSLHCIVATAWNWHSKNLGIEKP